MNHKKIIIFLFLFLIISVALFVNQALLDEADTLYWTDRYEEAKALLLSNLDKNLNNREKAEILWRLGRTTLAIGDELKAEGSSDDVLFATFEEGEEYANQSIASYPLAMGYVYHAKIVSVHLVRDFNFCYSLS
jgi:hypothetical protein